MKRSRPILKRFFLDEVEDEKIKSKMMKVNKKNFSDYAREMLLNGKVEVRDYSILREVRYEINKVGNNINQIVKLSHENGKVEKSELEKIIVLQEKLDDTISEIIKEIK